MTEHPTPTPPPEQPQSPSEPSPAFLEGLRQGMVLRQIYDLEHSDEEER